MKKLDIQNVKDTIPGFAGYSKDSYLQHIFECIGTTNKYYVEIGATEGFNGSVCWYLRDHCGWSGLLLDRGYGENLSINKRVEIVDRDNVIPILKKYNVLTKPDLLSIDIDGNDYWVLSELIKEYTPRVIIAESNIRFHPHAHLARKYDPTYNFGFSKWWGASPYCYKKLGDKYGYTPVCKALEDLFLVKTEFLHDDDKNTPWESVYPGPDLDFYKRTVPVPNEFEPDMWVTPEL